MSDGNQSRCCCPPSASRRECIEIRYNHVPGAPCDDRCECVCHDADDADEADWYAEQAAPRPSPAERVEAER